jgi:hypothetical protein
MSAATSKPATTKQHGPVALGLGYRATFTLAPAVEGVASLTIEFTPSVPELRDCRRMYAKYSKERDKFLKMAMPHAGSVIRVEVK